MDIASKLSKRVYSLYAIILIMYRVIFQDKKFNYIQMKYVLL